MPQLDVVIDFWLFWIAIGFLGILMYYWAKATDQVKRWKLAKILDKLGVLDVEQD